MSEDEHAARGSAAQSATADALSVGPSRLSRRFEPVAGEAADLPDGGGPLGAALDAFASRPHPRDFTALEAFLAENAEHPCAPSVRASLADEYLACGRYGDAIDAYRSAWQALSGAASRGARALAGEVLLELVRLSVVFADAGELEGYVSAAEELGLAHGEALLAEARRSLWMMRHEPGLAYRCGAAAALSVYSQLLRG